MEGASETVCERLLKLGFNRRLVDHRPDLGNLASSELVKDVLGEDDPLAIHREAEKETLRPALESQPARNVRRFADHEFDGEPEVRDLLEIALQHGAVAGKTEGTAVVARVAGDEFAQIWPILRVKAGDIVAVEVGEGGFGHGAT